MSSVQKPSKKGSCSPRPLQSRIAGSENYAKGFIALSAPSVKNLRGDALYAELDLEKDSFPAKRLIFGDAAVRQEAILVERTATKQGLDAEKREGRAAEKKKREDQASKREVLPHLPVTGNTPGRLMIGRPPANKTIVRTPMKSPPKPKPKPVPSSAPVLRQRGGKGGGGADDDEFATPRRTPSRMMFRKMDPATYVDFYLNGGKHDPPSESLMEEVNRQRNREAGIRRVGHFEGRFKGVMKSPLGGYGRRFHKTVAPLSVEQIAKYREEGRRRPLLLEGGDGGGGYLQGPV